MTTKRADRSATAAAGLERASGQAWAQAGTCCFGMGRSWLAEPEPAAPAGTRDD